MRIGIPFLLVVMLCTATKAADLSGTWQADGRPQRVLKIEKPSNGLRAQLYNLGRENAGEWRNGNTISSISQATNTITFGLDREFGSFSGTLSDDGSKIAGTWTSYGNSKSLTFLRATKATVWAIDPSPHKVRFVTVQPGVRLEVLDWGGNGPPLVFLAGSGCTAHTFDDFAPNFTHNHHVLGITRRGFGISSAPPATDANYNADRLGDDVLKVIDALKLEKPVLAGHSLGGEELSSVGTRHPEKISGLIYLEAAYGYAFDDPAAQDDIYALAWVLNHDLKQSASEETEDQTAIIKADLARMQNAAQLMGEVLQGIHSSGTQPTPQSAIYQAIWTGEHLYTAVKAPALAIFVVSRPCGDNCDSLTKALAKKSTRQAEAFENGNPNARVVRVTNGSHFVWRSNEGQVEQEMNVFMDGLR